MDQDSEILLEDLKREYLHPPSDQVWTIKVKTMFRVQDLQKWLNLVQGYNRTMIPLPSPSNKSSYFFSQYEQDQFLDRHVFKGKLKVARKFMFFSVPPIREEVS